LGLSSVLESLHANKSITKTVYLIDDNSKNKQICKPYEKVPWIKSIRFDEDKGFGFCVNHAVKQGEANICIVLHSDIFNLPSNFVKNLTAALIAGKNDNVALVSAYVDNPMPKSCLWTKTPNKPDYSKDYELLENDQWLPFMCVAFSKSAFSKAGGLASYPYCWFEDKLLSDKFKAFGYKMAMANKVHVRHKGGVTISKLINENPKILEIVKQNKLKYEKESEILNQFLNSRKKT
jgi:GT2 family glycosyltransferase